MESRMYSVVESDGAEPDQNVELFAPEVIQVKQQQQARRIISDDGSELIGLPVGEYEEMVRRPSVADWLYERQQRFDITEKYRASSEALARENQLVMRLRQLLIKNRLQLEPARDDDATEAIGELPEAAFFRTNRAEFELRGRDTASRVQPTEEAAPPDTELTPTTPVGSVGLRRHQSVLEPDEAVAVSPPVFIDAAPPSTTPDHRKSSSGSGKVDDGRRLDEENSRRLLEEASDAVKTVAVTTASTASRDLLQKVIQQNAKLKRLLRQIVDSQGMTVRQFLESSDYAELVDKLQKEIDQLRSKIKEQRQLLVSDDSKLTATCVALTDKVQNLEHSSAVKQALIDVYSAECARLQGEVKRLSVNDDVTSSEDAESHSQQQRQQHEPKSRDSTAAVNIQKLSQDFVELREKYLESERLHRSRAGELERLLSQKTERVKQLEASNKTLRTVLQQVFDAAATKQAVAEAKKPSKLQAACGQSRHLGRPWMTSLPQTELMADCGYEGETSSRGTSSKSTDKPHREVVSEADVGESSRDAEPVTPVPAADADDTKDDEDDADVKTFICRRCEREYHDQTRYDKHCMKCCDD